MGGGAEESRFSKLRTISFLKVFKLWFVVAFAPLPASLHSPKKNLLHPMPRVSLWRTVVQYLAPERRSHRTGTDYWSCNIFLCNPLIYLPRRLRKKFSYTKITNFHSNYLVLNLERIVAKFNIVSNITYPHCAYIMETLLVGDRINDNKTLAIFYV